jgi:uncharacterized repeat protein (TIGR04076 family)
MCPHAYMVAYPYALALLYDAKFPGAEYTVTGKNALTPESSVIISCPCTDNRITLRIRIQYTFPLLLRLLKKAAIRTLQTLGIDAEYPDKNVILDVVSVNGQCPQGMQKGKSYLFNIKDRKELCPASFYGAYPLFLRAAARGGECGEISVHCPDPFGVQYGDEGKYSYCDSISTKDARVDSVTGVCPRQHEKDSTFELKGPQGMCPLAFYAVFPYYLTLIHNGNFEWVRKGDSVKVQCPKPGGVAMEVEPVEIDSHGIGIVRARIFKLERSCPLGHALGDSFLLDSRNQTLCFHAAATVIPVSFSPISDVPQLCVGSNNSVIFKVKDHDDSL